MIAEFAMWGACGLNLAMTFHGCLEHRRRRVSKMTPLSLTAKSGPCIPVQLECGNRTLTVWMLVDTGASHTMIDSRTLFALGAAPHPGCNVPVNFGGAIRRDCTAHVLDLSFPGTGFKGFRRQVVFGFPFNGLDHYGTIGRDILQEAEVSIKGNRAHLLLPAPEAGRPEA